MNVKKKNLVLGLGESGFAAASLLLQKGGEVFIADSRDAAMLGDRPAKLRELGAEVCLGECDLNAARKKYGFECCIISPGIPETAPMAKIVDGWRITVISELELGWSFCENKLVAVTGSNGKSTVLKLCCEMLENAGLRVACGGNYGEPLSAISGRPEMYDVVLIEVSSFQLERVMNFEPDIGAVLNIQPNHLDRHKTMSAYTEIKGRLFRNMGLSGTAIAGVDVFDRMKECGTKAGKWLSAGTKAGADLAYVNGAISGHTIGLGELDIRGTKFDNIIMGQGAAVAAGIAFLCGAKETDILSAIQNYQALPHRMEMIKEIDGVIYINNSKATTLSSIEASLIMTERPVRLLAGGILKENDVSFIKKKLAEKARAVYLFGKDALLLGACWKDVVECRVFGSLSEAFAAASGDARQGEAVMLAPGCASFDQYCNYCERGNEFVGLVKKL